MKTTQVYTVQGASHAVSTAMSDIRVTLMSPGFDGRPAAENREQILKSARKAQDALRVILATVGKED